MNEVIKNITIILSLFGAFFLGSVSFNYEIVSKMNELEEFNKNIQLESIAFEKNLELTLKEVILLEKEIKNCNLMIENTKLRTFSIYSEHGTLNLEDLNIYN